MIINKARNCENTNNVEKTKNENKEGFTAIVSKQGFCSINLKTAGFHVARILIH